MRKTLLSISIIALSILGNTFIIHAMGKKAEVKPSSADIEAFKGKSEGQGQIGSLKVDKKQINVGEGQQCSIVFQMMGRAQVKLSVVDESGIDINIIADQVLDAGPHVFLWDASRVSQGTYKIVLKTKKQKISEKIEILR